MIAWALILIPSASFGLLCAYYIKGRLGPFVAGIIPWLGLLCYILYSNYFEGGVEMWQVAQLFGGTAAAVTGVVSYGLGKDFLSKRNK